MSELPPRTAASTRTTMTEYVLPTHANALGNVFGGQVLAWMDICAAICAQRHCGRIAVTAGIDELAFVQPIKLGQVARIDAVVTAAFRTSLEIEVTVTGEDAATGVTWPCVAAFMTFVALDERGLRAEVPRLLSGTEDEARRAREAESRRAERLAKRAAPRT